MLGDLDGDHRWTAGDLALLDRFLKGPFAWPDDIALRLDMNQNGLIDEEDIRILRALVASGSDPYAAGERARIKGESFPRPRELYRYVSLAEYRPRPLWALPYPLAQDSVLDWLRSLRPTVSTSSYSDALSAAIYAEAIRFDQAWRKREPELLPIERAYATQKLARMKALQQQGEQYELLLALMDVVRMQKRSPSGTNRSPARCSFSRSPARNAEVASCRPVEVSRHPSLFLGKAPRAAISRLHP